MNDLHLPSVGGIVDELYATFIVFADDCRM
jgi:hypothetical protein